jgi:phage terminase large subunit-like protein
MKPDKSKSTERIDGVVALVMGVGRAVLQPEPREPQYQVFFVGGRL